MTQKISPKKFNPTIFPLKKCHKKKNLTQKNFHQKKFSHQNKFSPQKLHYLALSCTILHHLAPSCTILHHLAPSCTILHHLAHASLLGSSQITKLIITTKLIIKIKLTNCISEPDVTIFSLLPMISANAS